MTTNHCIRGCQLCTIEIDLFSSLPREKQNAFSSLAKHNLYEKGELIFRQGDLARSLYIIHMGRVKLHSFDTEGKETIFEILGPQDTLAEEFFLENTVYPYSASCMEDTLVCVIRRDDFMRFLYDEPEAMMKMMGAMSRKLRLANERAALLFENDALVRLASFLYYQTLKNQVLDVNLTVDEIAGSINLRRETVSRKIGQLQKEGYIHRVGQSGIHVEDVELLKSFIDGAHPDRKE